MTRTATTSRVRRRPHALPPVAARRLACSRTPSRAAPTRSAPLLAAVVARGRPPTPAAAPPRAPFADPDVMEAEEEESEGEEEEEGGTVEEYQELLNHQIRAIMMQHAEDMKRMPPAE